MRHPSVAFALLQVDCAVSTWVLAIAKFGVFASNRDCHVRLYLTMSVKQGARLLA